MTKTNEEFSLVKNKKALAWFKKYAPALTNNELIDRIEDLYSRRMSIGHINQLRIRYKLPQRDETRVRAFAKASSSRSIWPEGFEAWFKSAASDKTNEELVTEAIIRLGKPVTRNQIATLRVKHRSPMNAEAMARVRQKTKDAQKGITATTPDSPKLSPAEQLEADLARREILRLTGRQTFYEIVGEKLVQAVKTLPSLPVPKPPPISSIPGLTEEEWVLIISDIQAGLTVNFKESGGLGNFDTAILNDQITYLEQSIDNIKKYHRNVRRLHIFWVGDIIEGETIYGGQLREIEFGAIQQVLWCWERFSEFQRKMAGLFQFVECRGVVGNHGRMGRKGEHSPMSNFDYLLYKMWEERMKPVTNLTWKVSDSWWDVASVYKWKWLLVHGDDTGQSFAGIPFYAIMRHKARYRELLEDFDKVMADAKTKYGDFDYMAIGHHSIPGYFQNVFLNGSWPGGTEFSLKKMQLGNVPTQWLVGVHPRRGAVWHRPIVLTPR